MMMIKLLPDGQVQGRKQEEQHQEEQAHWNTKNYNKNKLFNLLCL